MVRKKRLTSIFLRLARRQNAKDWAQSAAVVSIGGIAITLFCGFLANSSSLEQRINRLCEQSAVADVYVTVDPRIGADRKEADMLLENIPDFYGAESRFTMYCTLGSQNALMAVSPDLPSYSHPYDLTKLTDDHRSDHFFLVDTFLTSDYLADGKIHIGEPTRVTMSLSSFGISSSSISALDLFLKEGAENPLKKNSLDMNFVSFLSFFLLFP